MAVPDIFGRQTDAFGGAFSADGAFITFAATTAAEGGAGAASAPLASGVGLLTQNIQVSYQQQVTRIYEIGTNYHYLIAGRTSGQTSIGRILGPRPVSVGFYRKFGNVCNAKTNNLELYMVAGCSTVDDAGTARANLYENTNMRFRLLFCLINSITLSMNAQDMLVSEGLQMMFCSLLADQPASATIGPGFDSTGTVGGTSTVTGGTVGGSSPGGGTGDITGGGASDGGSNASSAIAAATTQTLTSAVNTAIVSMGAAVPLSPGTVTAILASSEISTVLLGISTGAEYVAYQAALSSAGDIRAVDRDETAIGAANGLGDRLRQSFLTALRAIGVDPTLIATAEASVDISHIANGLELTVSEEFLTLYDLVLGTALAE